MLKSSWLIVVWNFLPVLQNAKCSTVCGQFICFALEACCEGKCCLRKMYDVNEKSEVPYRILSYDSYAYSFWNVWYFWFIVIFIAISCFGGCGYWRRHRYTHRLSHRRIESSRFPRERCNSRTPIQNFDIPNGQSEDRTFPNSTLPPLRFIHHVGNYLHPPPYSEVTSKPDMYPLVQGRHHLDLSKNDPLAFVYANTNFIHLYMPYNSGTINYLSSPAESNSSSIFQSTTPSNFMPPPQYNEETNCQSHQTRVSTPCSILSACTPSSYIEPYTFTTHYLSTLSPPMATTPTSQLLFSEVTTPGADSLVASPTSFSYNRCTMTQAGDNLQLPNDPFTTSQEHLLTALVADIENMTNKSMNDADGLNAAERHGNVSSLNDLDRNAVDKFGFEFVPSSKISGTSSLVSQETVTSSSNDNSVLPHSMSLGSRELRNYDLEERTRCASDSNLT